MQYHHTVTEYDLKKNSTSKKFNISGPLYFGGDIRLFERIDTNTVFWTPQRLYTLETRLLHTVWFWAIKSQKCLRIRVRQPHQSLRSAYLK